ncbi:MAG: hypothetical protein A2X64_06770 [Ignavibacteria bacterium GWF2_33_9]|nr:MAG: hypothetical protein A2X64_06770 [Ignavibacteria bacterium GWF2_33_9]
MADKNLAIIILAAGQGKRMNNPNLPKVLVELKQIPLLQYVLVLSMKVQADPIISIVGHHREKVINFLNIFSHKLSNNTLKYAVQAEQLGTGHAVQQSEILLNEFNGNVLILSGDVPLLSEFTITNFLKLHKLSEADLSVLSSIAPNPFGYGRIVRTKNGDFERIVEEKDADERIRLIDEINSGIYLVKKDLLFSSLRLIQNENAQGEFYLTDIIEINKKAGKNVQAFNIGKFEEIQGINSQDDLENVAKNLG